MTSVNCRLAARDLTSTSPSPGSGIGWSTTLNPSGPPNRTSRRACWCDVARRRSATERTTPKEHVEITRTKWATTVAAWVPKWSESPVNQANAQ